MSEPNAFDPYHRWLGIRPEEQPAGHYRLLALARFEDDPEVIRDAAERQMGHVRRYALGEHRKVSQKILNELAAAKACLLDERKKAKYDEQLREEVTATEEKPLPIAEQDAGPSSPPIAPARASTVTADSSEPSAFSNMVSGGPTGRRQRGVPGRRASPTLIGAAVAGACVLLALALWTVAQRRPNAGGTGTIGSDVAGPKPKAVSVGGIEEPAPTAPEDANLVFSWPLPERIDTRLWIDDEAKVLPRDGNTTIRFALEPGTHSLKVERQGFEPIDVPDIQLSEGESMIVPLHWRAIRTEPRFAVAPFDEAQARRHQEAWADHLGLDVEITNSIGMRLVLIPPGEFMMGSPESEEHRDNDEHQHRVRITRPFYLGVTEVAQGQWEAVMGTRPWSGKPYVKEGLDYAAGCVSWEDAQAFCESLSKKEDATYRLPTEAEWEYACRAGTTMVYHFGDDTLRLGEYAWFRDNASAEDERYAHSVGQKKANRFALYDMHGNVWESCADWYDSDYYAGSPTDDPSGAETGSHRVSRGGSHGGPPWVCRSAHRNNILPGNGHSNLGFRVARSPSGK